jgi:Ca2+:H+ antiporter
MKALLKEILHTPILWPLIFIPVLFAAEHLKPEAHSFPQRGRTDLI